MRLWSLHPQYLDRQGLVALWREALLAQKVLAGKTKGYRHHPQLERFKECRDPLRGIGTYLRIVADEADRRGYHFDRSKILKKPLFQLKLLVTRGQVDFEKKHLLRKLKIRDPKLYRIILKKQRFRTHPLFQTIPGAIAVWEKI